MPRLGTPSGDDFVEQPRRRATQLTHRLADRGQPGVAGGHDVVPAGDQHLAGYVDLDERWAAVERVAADRAGTTVATVAVPVLDEATGQEVARAALDDALPDAFVCGNDELALGVLSGLGAAGVDVPGQVLVTGWDDVMAARYAGLTTVRQPMRELGGTAARLLDEVITGGRAEPRHVVLPTELVVRTTSGA